MPETTMYPAPVPSPARRRVALLAVTLPSVVVAALVVVFLVDDPLIPVGDLEPPPRMELADQDNLLWHLQEAHAGLAQPGEFHLLELSDWVADPQAYAREWLDDGSTDNGPTWGDVERYVEHNRPVLERVLASVACASYQAPRSGLVDPSEAHLSDVRELVTLLVFDTHLRIRKHDWMGARASACAGVIIGRRMATNPASLIEGMIGVGLQRMALSGLLALALEEDLPLEDLRATVSLCSATGFVGEAYDVALMWDHMTFRNELELAIEKEVEAEGEIYFMPPGIYQPHRTRNRMANGFREILQLCRAPVWSGGFEVDEPDLRRMKLGGNLIGDILYHLLMPTYDTVLERQFQGRCWLRLGPLAMAIRLHERQHGRRPASLAELVPAILPELPRDPFTGEPFRYSSSEGTVYSVGRNQRDEGGLQEHDGDADDCGLHLDTGREIVDSPR